MDLLLYFGRPILFIPFCMTVVWFAGLKQNQLGWITQSKTRWLVAWSFLGLMIAVVLAITALIMNNNYIASHAEWVWPFCMGLVAFDGRPSPPTVLLLLAIAGLQNALLYFTLAAIVRFALGLIARNKKPRVAN